MNNLAEQIETKRKETQTESYPMSIGELVNIYKEGDLDIHPEFQRMYRWTHSQKTRLIESILLGIPIPSIFLSQRDDGIWDLIDGLQRLSTIFSFLGIYKDDEGHLEPPLQLLGTEYLPLLKDKYWDDSIKADAEYISKDLQRAFKREKIDLKIIKKESDGNSKYELFQRLNTGGTPLSPQEVRNCLLIMINSDFYSWFSDLAANENFRNTLTLSSKQSDEKYDMELVLRYLAFKDIPEDRFNEIGDVGDFLTDQVKAMANSDSFDFDLEKQRFEKTFELLNTATDENTFRKYEEGKYTGGFLTSLFETIACGLGHNIEKYTKIDIIYIDKIQDISLNLLGNEEYTSNSGAGKNAASRIPKLLPLGRGLFLI